MSARASRLAVLAITLLAFALRVAGLLSQSLWRDEVDALLFATRPLEQFVAMFRQPGQNGPLFFLGLRPWLGAAGHSEFALRYPAVLAGTLSIPVLYALVSRLAGRKVALAAALLLSTAPYGVWYGQEAKMYALLTALVPATLLAIAQVARGATRRARAAGWVALYVLTSLSFYIHLLAALALPVQALWLLILPRGRVALRTRNAAIYFLALLLPYVPFLRWLPGMWGSSFQTGHPFAPLDDIVQVLAGAFSRGVLGIQPISLLPYMVALVAGLIVWPLAGRGSRTGALPPRGRVTILLAAWMALPPLLIYLVSLGMPIFTDRYLIWAMPAFLAVLACGIVSLLDEWRPLGITVGAVILALNGWSMYLQAAQPIKADFRDAAAYVLARRQPGDAVMYQIPYNRYTFSYYASPTHDPEDAAWQGVEGPFTNAGMGEAEADAWMATRLGGAHGVWLISSEASMWDERDLTGQWLKANATETDRAEFARVTGERYQR
jgi:4-amino-4-deoxy-L-arabinose transferase-like glycosyltransferase